MVQKLKQQEWWYWLVKEFAYNGLTEKELNSLSLEKLLAVFPARARRSLTRGINDNNRKLRAHWFSVKNAGSLAHAGRLGKRAAGLRHEGPAQPRYRHAVMGMGSYGRPYDPMPHNLAPASIWDGGREKKNSQDTADAAFKPHPPTIP